jgi:hypothetical protein
MQPYPKQGLVIFLMLEANQTKTNYKGKMDIMIKLFENEQVGKKLLLENNYKWPFFLLKYQSPTIIQGLVFLYVVAFYNIIFVFFT